MDFAGTYRSRYFENFVRCPSHSVVYLPAGNTLRQHKAQMENQERHHFFVSPSRILFFLSLIVYGNE